MNLIELSPSVIIDPSQVVSIQDETVDRTTPSGFGSMGSEWVGCVLTMTNGRKIFVEKKLAKDVFELIKAKEF